MSKPDGEKQTHSGLGLTTSEADFDNLPKQITDTIRYLKRNREKLLLIPLTKGIEHAVLDFGIDLRIGQNDIYVQSDRFPNTLLKLAGELGMSMELSMYPPNFEELAAFLGKGKKSKPSKNKK